MNRMPIDDIETLSMDELHSRIEKPALREQLLWCMERSVFYRRKFGSAKTDPTALFENGRWDEIPFTEKHELIEDQLAHPPFGSNLCVAEGSFRRVHRTSGSTGRPLYVVLTEHDIHNTMEAGARCFRSAGLRQEHTVVHCLNYCMWMGGLSDHMSLEKTGATVIPYGVGNSKALIELIRDLSIKAISCTPSYMARLEEVARNELKIEPRDVGLKLGLFGGEPGIQQEATRRCIEETWGMKAVDANYGMADVLSMFASECEARDGLHFHGQGMLYVELIDPETGKVLPIEKGQQGELVYTNLGRESQPLIRFRSRDVAQIVGSERCSCGRGGFRFRIMGRSDDMLHVKGINVFPSAVGNIISRYSEIFTGEYEVVLKSPPPYHALPVRIERRGSAGSAFEGMLKSFVEAVRDELSIKIDCEILEEGSLGRTEGKRRRIIRSY